MYCAMPSIIDIVTFERNVDEILTLKLLANVIGPLVVGLLRVFLAATVMLPLLLQCTVQLLSPIVSYCVVKTWAVKKLR